MKMSPFVVGFLVFCGAIAAVAILTFTCVLPGFGCDKGPGVDGNVVVWGAFDSNLMTRPLSLLNFTNKDKFNLTYVQKDPNFLDEELTEALAENAGPDLVILPQELIWRHANKIERISYDVVTESGFKQAFVPQGDLFLTETGVLALPFFIDPLVLYYNDQILTGAGIAVPPRYWVDIQSPLSTGILKLITKSDERNNIVQSAIALGQFNNITHAKDILSLLIMQSGDGIVAGSLDSHSVQLGDGVDSALNFFIQFSDPSKEQYTWNSALLQSRDAFTSGKLAFYIGRASDLPLIKEANPHMRFNAVVVPQIDNLSTPKTFGQLYGVAVLKASGTKKPSAINAAIALTSNAFLSDLSEVFSLPVARRDLLGTVGDDNFKNTFNKSALISAGWIDIESVETGRIFKEMVENVLVGRSSVLNAVNRARDQMILIK